MLQGCSHEGPQRGAMDAPAAGCMASDLAGQRQPQQLRQQLITAECQDQNQTPPSMTCPDLPHHEAKVQLPAPALQLPHQLPASALQLPHQLPVPAITAMQLPHQLPAPALQLPQAQVQRLQLPEAGVQPPASFLQIPGAALLLICTAASSRWDAGPYTAQALRCTCRALRASVDSLIHHLRLDTTLGEVSIEGYASAYGLWLLGYALLLLIRSAEAAQKLLPGSPEALRAIKTSHRRRRSSNRFLYKGTVRVQAGLPTRPGLLL